MIFNKKKLPDLAWIERQGLLFVKIAQTFALRIDFLSTEKTMHLQQLYTQATPVAYDTAQLKQTLQESLTKVILHIN